MSDTKHDPTLLREYACGCNVMPWCSIHGKPLLPLCHPEMAALLNDAEACAAFHDRVWKAWESARKKDSMLANLSVHSLRTLADVMFQQLGQP